jgi:hypothetical protein
MATKEIRNGNLVATIKTKLPNVGYINLDTKSSGRKAFFSWRGHDFLVTSRLICKELGFGRMKVDSAIDTEDSLMLQERLKAEPKKPKTKKKTAKRKTKKKVSLVPACLRHVQPIFA